MPTFTELSEQVAALQKENAELQRKLRDVDGSPVIVAHAGARFDLNDKLNVLQLKKKIQDIDNSLDVLSKTSKPTVIVNNVPAGEPELKIEAGRNVRLEKNEKTKATIIHADKATWSSISLNGG